MSTEEEVSWTIGGRPIEAVEEPGIRPGDTLPARLARSTESYRRAYSVGGVLTSPYPRWWVWTDYLRIALKVWAGDLQLDRVVSGDLEQLDVSHEERLTERQREIVRLRKECKSVNQIAAELRVSKQAVSQVLREFWPTHRAWVQSRMQAYAAAMRQELPGLKKAELKKLVFAGRVEVLLAVPRKLSARDRLRAEVLRLHAMGLTQKTIGSSLGYTQSWVSASLIRYGVHRAPPRVRHFAKRPAAAALPASDKKPGPQHA